MFIKILLIERNRNPWFRLAFLNFFYAVKLLNQEIANELGTAREVISRLLKQLENKKWIDLGRHVIYIRDDFEELIAK